MGNIKRNPIFLEYKENVLRKLKILTIDSLKVAIFRLISQNQLCLYLYHRLIQLR